MIARSATLRRRYSCEVSPAASGGPPNRLSSLSVTVPQTAGGRAINYRISAVTEVVGVAQQRVDRPAELRGGQVRSRAEPERRS